MTFGKSLVGGALAGILYLTSPSFALAEEINVPSKCAEMSAEYNWTHHFVIDGKDVCAILYGGSDWNKPFRFSYMVGDTYVRCSDGNINISRHEPDGRVRFVNDSDVKKYAEVFANEVKRRLMDPMGQSLEKVSPKDTNEGKKALEDLSLN